MKVTMMENNLKNNDLGSVAFVHHEIWARMTIVKIWELSHVFSLS